MKIKFPLELCFKNHAKNTRVDCFTLSYYFVIALNASVCDLIPFSAANLSILDAPKNPSIPSVLSITYLASSGSAIGPHDRLP